MFATPLNPGGPSAAELLARKKSVLDFTLQDVERMRGRLAGTERAKLDQVLESIRGLESQLEKLSENQLECTQPTPPAANLDAQETVFGDVDPNGNNGALPSRLVDPAIADAFLALAETALVCRLTHSISIVLDRGGADTGYGFLGDPSRNMHTHCHNAHAGDSLFEDLPQNEDTARATDMLYKMWHYFGGRVVGLFERLKLASDGASNLADNGVMLWTSDSGGRHHNGNNEYPLILLGTGGGRLNPGRFLDFGDGVPGRNDLGNIGAASPRSLSDAFVTIAHALGFPLDTFGDPAHFKGVLPGVLR